MRSENMLAAFLHQSRNLSWLFLNTRIKCWWWISLLLSYCCVAYIVSFRFRNTAESREICKSTSHLNVICFCRSGIRRSRRGITRWLRNQNGFFSYTFTVTCFAFLCCFRMTTNKKKQDASHIEQDNYKTLDGDFYVLFYINNRVYLRFAKYHIANDSIFKFSKKIRMKCFKNSCKSYKDIFF